MTKFSFKAELIVDDHFSQKNDKKVFRKKGSRKTFIGTGQKTRRLKNALIRAFKSMHKTKPYDGPVNLSVKFLYGLNKDKSPKFQVIDLSNLYQGVEDSLQIAGVISDDKNILSHDGSGRFHHDGPPMILVQVTDLETDPRAICFTKKRQGETIKMWTLKPDFDYGTR